MNEDTIVKGIIDRDTVWQIALGSIPYYMKSRRP